MDKYSTWPTHWRGRKHWIRLVLAPRPHLLANLPYMQRYRVQSRIRSPYRVTLYKLIRDGLALFLALGSVVLLASIL